MDLYGQHCLNPTVLRTGGGGDIDESDLNPIPSDHAV